MEQRNERQKKMKVLTIVCPYGMKPKLAYDAGIYPSGNLFLKLSGLCIMRFDWIVPTSKVMAIPKKFLTIFIF